MIFIDMDGQEPPAAWLKKSDELTKELIRFHQAGDIAGRNKFIDDNSDHWGQIKEWLANLSHGKCWFSEAKEIYSHMDVEHFRPKKEAKHLDGTVRDGYWWLAFDYHNYRLCGNVGNRKKGGWFPLQDGSRVSMHNRRCENSEDAYLLDPTDPLDVGMLICDLDGSLRPADPNESSWSHQRARVTIQRLKLNEHVPLAELRRSIWQSVNQKIDRFRAAIQSSENGGDPHSRGKADEIARELRSMVNPKSELSTVAKDCIRSANDPLLLRLCA
ncbi:MAG: hypothetical protein IPK50_05100 [Fibrobacterota bacterium]|nr:MAG: hypothetical protein IPK50_05100 [Fibrobacterota bacterium]